MVLVEVLEQVQQMEHKTLVLAVEVGVLAQVQQILVVLMEAQE
tara:strand:+ start:363 stop:491 length:129 start_codon:yes stop_codon:yes gene_type:complete